MRLLGFELAASEVELHILDRPRAAAIPRQLTILTANLKNPFTLLGRESREALIARLETFARSVEMHRADILLCQEVGRTQDFRVDGWLATRLSFSHCYLRANGHVDPLGREEGLAIFSRFPPAQPAACLLGGGSWRRPALGASVHTTFGDVDVFTAHLSLRPWRNRRQIPRLRQWVESIAGERPAIVGGDFNASEGTRPMIALRSRWVDVFRTMKPADRGTTHRIALFGHTILRQRLDYLFLKTGSPEFRPICCQLIGSGEQRFSDHLAVAGWFAVNSPVE